MWFLSFIWAVLSSSLTSARVSIHRGQLQLPRLGTCLKTQSVAFHFLECYFSKNAKGINLLATLNILNKNSKIVSVPVTMVIYKYS